MKMLLNSEMRRKATEQIEHYTWSMGRKEQKNNKYPVDENDVAGCFYDDWYSFE